MLRNDVRIPPDTGTEFSAVDLIGSEASPAWRAELPVNVNRRHGVRVSLSRRSRNALRPLIRLTRPRA